MQNKEEFVMFWGGSFSQWAKSPFTLEGKTFNTAEQYMMYKKAMLFNDTEIAEKILAAENPRVQKALGRQVKGFDKEIWEANCKQFVYNGNLAKFRQNHSMYLELMATHGKTLVEASPEDKIWGIGLAENDSRAWDRSTWQGTNWLGEILTSVREYLILRELTNK